MKMKQTKCPCAAHVGPLGADHHDQLLTVEARGASGFTELLFMADLQSDGEYEDGQLRMVDFVDFVGFHNWQDPTGMYQFARLLRSLEGASLRRRNDAEAQRHERDELQRLSNEVAGWE